MVLPGPPSGVRVGGPLSVLITPLCRCSLNHILLAVMDPWFIPSTKNHWVFYASFSAGLSIPCAAFRSLCFLCSFCVVSLGEQTCEPRTQFLKTGLGTFESEGEEVHGGHHEEV